MPLQFVSQMPPDYLVLTAHSHSHLLVLLAFVVACVAGFTTLSLADRLAERRGAGQQALWKCAGAFSLGAGIWAMHFIGMLSFRMPVEAHYDLALTLLSLLLALAASYGLMSMMARREPTHVQLVVAAVLAGGGIAAMHYTGMAAVESIARQFYDPLLFAASVAIGMAASLAALLLVRAFRKHPQNGLSWPRLASSLLMGTAIVSMHFTGMAAMTLAAPADAVVHPASTGDVAAPLLAGVVAALTLLIIAAAIAASWMEQRIRREREALERVSSQLDSIMQYDALTGLPNGPTFVQLTDERFQRAVDSQYVVVVIDIDHFQRINDSLGNDIGDEALVEVARRLRTALRTDDKLARFSADEFYAAGRISSAADADRVVMRLLSTLQTPLSLRPRTMRITASVGYSLYPEDGRHARELIKKATLAVREAKQDGRNTARRFRSEYQQEMIARLRLEQQLREALSLNRLEVHYQPLIHAESGDVVSLEALARWRGEDGNYISPDVFIRVAEEHGLIGDLDRWVLRRALLDLSSLHRAGFDRLRVAVNFSALNFSDRWASDVIRVCLDECGVDGRHLTVEVTENAVMHSVSVAAEVLQAVKALGVKVAIDDFGTGHSSLAYLRKLPVDSLKVDKSFVRHIPGEQDDCEIAAAIIAMAHKLRLRVVAEGVETEGQLAFLRDNHCDLIQGYFISRPLPPEQLHAWLAQRELTSRSTQSA